MKFLEDNYLSIILAVPVKRTEYRMYYILIPALNYNTMYSDCSVITGCFKEIKVKVKKKMSICLTKNHAINTYSLLN
jgi:hypothetical protein